MTYKVEKFLLGSWKKQAERFVDREVIAFSGTAGKYC